ncbi:Protein SRC1, partial [Mucuna pruriens]
MAILIHNASALSPTSLPINTIQCCEEHIRNKTREKSETMSGIIHKIEETLHMGGHKKEGEHHGEQKGEHHGQGEHHGEHKGEHHGEYKGEHHGEHKGEHHGEEHKEGFVDKIKDKIHGEGEGHGDKKKKKKEKKKHEHGHDSSSSDNY